MATNFAFCRCILRAIGSHEKEISANAPPNQPAPVAARIPPGAPGIAMSGHLLDPAMQEPERHGFKGVLTKPFEREKLQENLARVMDRSPTSEPAP